MVDCIICGFEITESSQSTEKQTEAGLVYAHNDCILKLKAILGDSSIGLAGSKESTSFFVNKVNNDWILNRRNIPISMIILAYLNVQPEPCEVKSIYDWLRRNEVDSSNPAEYIKRLRNNGQITALKSKESRLIQITELGRKELISFVQRLEDS